MKRKISSALLACTLLVSACSAKTEIPMEREPQESHVKEETQMPQSKSNALGEEVTIPESKKSPAAPTQARIKVQPTASTPPVAAPRQTREAGRKAAKALRQPGGEKSRDSGKANAAPQHQRRNHGDRNTDG